MMNFLFKFLFMTTLITGTFITISSSSWIGMWMGLEINLMSFIPLMIDHNNLISNESSIKYFLIQVFASLIFLFVIIMYIIKFNFYAIYFNEMMIINSAMCLKLGAAPLHFWLPNLIDGLNWMNTLVLLTWQKLAPLMIISYSVAPNLIMMFILTTSFIGSVGGLNQTSLRKILTFSSINHMGWLLAGIFFNSMIWLFYFLLYFITNLSIILIFKLMNMHHINQLFMFKNNSPLIKFCFMMNFLSLGGLPPFLGFLPKWMLIENMIKMNQLMLLLFMMMMTLITLFFYIRISFSAFLMSTPSNNWINSSFMKINWLSNINLMLNFFMITTFFSTLMISYYLI